MNLHTLLEIQTNINKLKVINWVTNDPYCIFVYYYIVYQQNKYLLFIYTYITYKNQT